jgi:hypothetical protein
MIFLLVGACIIMATSEGQADVRAVKEIPTAPGALYAGNREPLLASPLVRLPIGSITPRGWLRHMLELEARGMTGRLEEISPWCKFEGNAWVSPTGEGHSGWEELPYWLKGYGDLGYVLHDEKIIAGARKWIDGVLAGQMADGWFGPRALRTSLDGKPDLWPNMVMLNALQSFHDATGDERVPAAMKRFFQWEMNVPEKDFLAGFWPNVRAGDNLESVTWLYNRTGEAWLLDLAAKIHRRAADWTAGVASWHGVNIAQSFREPAMYFVVAREPKFLAAAERNYDTVMDMYGQAPGGGFGADENCRPGYVDPRQGFETCSIVEFMHSFEMLMRITSNPLWADRCEEIALNTFPASMTPDLKALHYLTAPNMVQLDRTNKSPGLQNGGNMLGYSPFAGYRCCQHNVSHGWPYYAEELWLATGDRGLCASLYAASEVSAKVGDGTVVKIVETTDYPFGDTVELRVTTPKGVRFPLYLRVPRWCENPALKINGRKTAVKAEPLSYIAIDRVWAKGDTVSLQMPMKVSVRTWTKNKGAVSVDRGPLTYSLKIGERWARYGGTEEWPEQEVFPMTPWNYGLVLKERNPAASIEVAQQKGPVAEQPFTPETAPIALRTRARRIAAWQQEGNGLVAVLQQSPARTAEPEETVTLIPMGCARLRIAAFPRAGTGAEAHEWTPPPLPPLASHCWASDTVMALNDGIEPSNSNDQGIPRFTWWDHLGTTEWVAYQWPAKRQVSGVEVYWFDDTGVGMCRVLKAWRVLYRDGDAWKPVKAHGDCGVKRDQYNRVEFDPVTTDGLRLEVDLQQGFSGGILEWKVLP